MKTLYLDCGMGAAGDMLTAALYELLDEREKQEFLAQMNALGLPGVEVCAEAAEKCGITGTHMRVAVGGAEEDEHPHEHDHEHEHDHDHHDHEHSALHAIEHRIAHLPVSERVRRDIAAVYGLIAEAESHVHGVPVTQIHFHEVGSLDALADVAAVCWLMEKLAPERVTASPVHVGSGHVRCAHGVLPVPAPATAWLLRGVPVYGGEIRGELCTPTGAALLRHFVTEFGPMPVMRVERIGYGMGKKDFPMANCIRALLGEIDETGDEVCELSCNLDDMTAERIGFALERFFEAGALEAYTIPVGMKKSRPGVLLSVMCRQAQREELLRLIFLHTTTLGVRENLSRRYTLRRSVEQVKTSFGSVRVKRAEGYGTVREKYEYDDLAGIARETGLSLDEIVKRIENEKKG